MKNIRSVILGTLICGSVVGCGPASDSVPVQAVPSNLDAIKKGLEEIAETGSVGSAVEDLRGLAFQLEDKAKADALQAGLDELSVATDPAKAKALAKKLLSGL